MSSSRDKLTSKNNQPISSSSLGNILKNRREELELTLDKVERDTKIRQEYIRYIEASNYERLRDDIYSRGYIKNYADYLGLETAPIMLLYKKERSIISQNLKLRDNQKKRRIGLTPINSPRFIITPKSFVILTIMALAALALSYMVWQFSTLSSAPSLTLDNPNEETVTSPIVFVAGHVDGGADVFVNDSPILTNGEGAFREKIALVDGTNQIKISAKNRLGKTSALTKTYIAKLSKDQTQATGLITTIDGVSLAVKIGASTSWIIVVADDVEIYRGTMLSGSTQTFSAANKLKISVGNAGSVNATLTNSQVASKEIGTFGREGEIKRDLEFNKDTQTL